jgi:hypothetical protein
MPNTPEPLSARISTTEGADPREVGAMNDAADLAQDTIEKGQQAAPLGQEPKPQMPGYSPPKPSYADEDEELLYGPTSRPNDPMQRGVTQVGKPPPQNIMRQLPALIEAARQPDAPPQLIAFLQLLLNQLGEV